MMQKLSKIFAPIVTAVVIGVIVIVMFTSFSFTNRITSSFWTTTLLGTALTMLTTFIWLPVGIENGKKQKNFIVVSKQYNKRADYIVENQLQTKCNDFCEHINQEFALKLLKNKLSKVCLTVEFFEDYKRYCCKAQINDDRKKEIENLSKKQIKVLDKLRDKEIKFAHLETSDLLKVKAKAGRIKPLNQEKIYKSILWIGKVLWAICSFAVLAFILVDPNTTSWLSKVFQLLIWLLIICFNIFMSLYNGYKSITEYRKNYLVDLSTKCAQFFEFVNISLSDVDKVEEIEDEQIEELG